MAKKTQLPYELSFAVESFLLDAKARNLRPATVLYYGRQLRAFARFAQAHSALTLPDLTPALLRAYIASLHDRGLADASVHAAARALRAWCNFLEADGLVQTSPMRRVKMPKRDRPRPDAFTEAEVQRLLDACPTARDTAIVLCLLDTGCRAGEFLALDVGDINLRVGTVLVRNTKDREQRTVYLGYRARRAVLRYLAERGSAAPASPAWATLTGDQARLTYGGLRQLLRRLGNAAKVEPCSAHKFRRTFALWSLRAGMDVHSLAKLLGHADLQMLRHYIGLAESDLQAAHAKAGPVDRLGRA